MDKEVQTPRPDHMSVIETSSACAERLRNAWNVSTKNGWLSRSLDALSPDDIETLYYDWRIWARDDQWPPGARADGTPWRLWLILGGRGAGKTRTGAEWVRAKVFGEEHAGDKPASRIALVAETLADARRVMVQGVSGLLAIHPDRERPRFEVSKMQLVWPNGAVAQIFSAENPDSLRGPQFDAAWCDELAKWREPERTWDMLQFGLRLGTCPQVCVTTTPRPIPLLKKLLADSGAVVSRAATHANKSNLAPGFIAEMERRYLGSALGRQELLGELVDERTGSLWRRDWIDEHRSQAAPDLARVVVAIDPPVTATANSDSCGIVVAARGGDGRCYVLADRTIQGREPHVWARAALAAFHDFDADCLVAEVNQGGDMVVSILQQIEPNAVVRKVRATRGKWLRAEPVAALYAEGRVSHAGSFDRLEDQMCTFGADGLSGRRSPDRLDALVWAVTELMLEPAASPAIRQL
jgi:phage terminase large subunit-like protein